MNNQSSQTLESMSQATWYNRWTQTKFSKYLTGKILEIGCGIGNFSSYLAKYGRLTAIDINYEYLHKAKDRVDKNVRVGFGNIESGQYFFDKEIFDTIVCINVLEHISKDKKALKNIYQLLAQNGTLILLLPAHGFLYNSIDKSIGHFRRYEKDKIEYQLKDTGFEILSLRRLNFLGAIGWFIAGKIFKDKSISEDKIKIFNLVSPVFLTIENIFEPMVGTSILVVARKK